MEEEDRRENTEEQESFSWRALGGFLIGAGLILSFACREEPDWSASMLVLVCLYLEDINQRLRRKFDEDC